MDDECDNKVEDEELEETEKVRDSLLFSFLTTTFIKALVCSYAFLASHVFSNTLSCRHHQHFGLYHHRDPIFVLPIKV